MSIAAQLDAELTTAGLPIEGVSIGDEADKSTWLVHFDGGSVTGEQVSAVDAIIAAFVAAPAPVYLQTAAIMRALDGSAHWAALQMAMADKGFAKLYHLLMVETTINAVDPETQAGWAAFVGGAAHFSVVVPSLASLVLSLATTE